MAGVGNPLEEIVGGQRHGHLAASCVTPDITFATSLKSIMLYDENERASFFG